MTTRWISFAIIFCIGLAIGAASVMSTPGMHHDQMATADSPATHDSGNHAQPEKQLYTCGMHPQVIVDHPGNCPICNMKLVPMKSAPASQPAEPKGQSKILYYWDPMLGPSSISDKPGKSAMGMDLVPVYENQNSAGPPVRIDPSVVQNMGIRTVMVERGSLEKTVRAVGFVQVPEPGLHDISLKVNGWIQKLYANQDGMYVSAGDPLFDLYSPELLVAQEELISATRTLNALDAGSSSSARKDAENLVASAKQKLRRWDIADQDIDAVSKSAQAMQTLPYRSPATGHLADKMIVQGSPVQAGMKVMRIEDHSQVWLNVQVFEEQLPYVKVGQIVQATAAALPGRVFVGPISFIYPHVDHMARTTIVRVTIDNPKHELRPGMYATAEIITKPVSDTVVVPRESIIDTGTRQIAFVLASDGSFQPRNVRMGVWGDDDRAEILEGLAPGETVVTSGQFLLDVESRTTEAINKLRHSTSAPSDR
ncbi:MAG TPA: efflux RND transporter periplasmic adaptor subunit [Tepidisphaeraceae bacterium]|nr:efflux RND transporter periplasmic adaptor subunit [Tepidisphaeraceae bacterium]